jgi:hypothetical protein
MIYPYSGCCSQPRGWDRVCSLANYEAAPGYRCPECGKQLTRLYTPSQLLHTKPFESFVSPVDGSVINNKRELAEHNRRNKVVQLHEGYDEKAVNNFVNRDWGTKSDIPDLKNDMKEAVVKLEQGYKPVLAPESTPLE